jgi:hypothetical protein
MSETRRHVHADLQASYDEAWLELRGVVEAVSGHAWRFRHREDSSLFVEFIEHGASRDPRDHPEVLAALDALDRISAGSVEAFVDAPASIEKGRG